VSLFESASDLEAQAQAATAAAPALVERADLAMVQTLDPALRQPMFALLSSLADNKYLLGRRYAEWCTGAPLLESAVAAAAMAQDELGHARSFYPLLKSFLQLQLQPQPHGRDLPSMEDKGWQTRPTSAMRCLDRHFGAWADFVAANVVVDSALTTLLSAAMDSPYEPLRQRARKIVHEEAAHWVHGSGWLRRLGASPVMEDALNSVWDDVMTWFGQADDPTLAPLGQAGLLSDDPESLRAQLRARLTPLFDQLGLTERLMSRRLPWHRWDPRARRLSAPAEKP
jgi:phenylacetate-CoA oxygenase PaaI subunit